MKRFAGLGGVPPRLVVDTNVFVSALLFGGVASRLVSLWQMQRVVYLLSRSILEEYLRVLSYPKFNLTEMEIRALIDEELLPYVKTVPDPSLKGVPYLKDSSDRIFLACSKTGKADYLLTGDKELLALKKFLQAEIVPPAEFLNIWS